MSVHHPPREPARDARIPPGSADYSAALADATLYKQGALSFAELQARVLWGEIAMTLFAGELTREEYDRLHAAAHPGCTR